MATNNPPQDLHSYYNLLRKFTSTTRTDTLMKHRFAKLSFTNYNATPTFASSFPSGWISSCSVAGITTGGNNIKAKTTVTINMQNMVKGEFCMPNIEVVGTEANCGNPTVTVQSMSHTQMVLSVESQTTEARTGPFELLIELVCYEDTSASSSSS